MKKRGFASTGGSVSPVTLCNEACASTEAKSRGPNIGIIMTFCNAELPEIKLVRTDTTHDLSQRQRELRKKEKRKRARARRPRYIPPRAVGIRGQYP